MVWVKFKALHQLDMDHWSLRALLHNICFAHQLAHGQQWLLLARKGKTFKKEWE